MSEPSQQNFNCPECGARTHTPELRCWLCCRESAAAETRNPFASPMATSHQPKVDTGWFQAMLLLATVGVICGAWMADSGTGLVATAILVPVAIRSLLVFHVRSAKNLPTTILGRARMVLESTIATTLMYALLSFIVVVSLVIALFAACFTALAGGNENTFLAGIGIGGLAGLGFAGWLIFSWARSRWNRDTEAQDSL